MRTPRHLPKRNNAARDLRKKLKDQREFDKKFGENWAKIRETQRFENSETQYD